MSALAISLIEIPTGGNAVLWIDERKGDLSLVKAGILSLNDS
jgi:hypothetical protein